MSNVTVEDVFVNSNRFAKEPIFHNTTGLWEILGEDPNCDFGGHHHNPSLGFASGCFSDVAEYALEFDNFITWGQGGKLRLIKDVKQIPKGYSSKKKIEDRNKAKELKEQIKKLEDELTKIESKNPFSLDTTTRGFC